MESGSGLSMPKSKVTEFCFCMGCHASGHGMEESRALIPGDVGLECGVLICGRSGEQTW